MEEEEEELGVGSRNRYADLNRVAPAGGQAQTTVVARVYINNVEIDLQDLRDGGRLSDRAFFSGDRSYANSAYSTW
ncbi:hypothetical protein [Krasilnikovia sp. M28-CT-15]|uniref:hypothetical protein n=1 Tax=Krasilnikovia sp. M28-CT-15 TaxID=3373540 RepID=UPI003875F815